MDEILQDLHDPRWWFTAIFIAILVSVLSGFLKDATARWIARYSEWYRKKMAATLARREFHLEMLVSNPALLSAHNSLTITRLVLLVMLLAVFLYMPIFIELAHSGQSPYFSRNRPADFTLMYNALRTFLTLVGLTCIYVGYIAMSYLAVTRRAYYALLRRHLAMLKEEIQHGQGNDIPPGKSLCEHEYVSVPPVMGQREHERLRCRFCEGHFVRHHQDSPVIQIPTPE